MNDSQAASLCGEHFVAAMLAGHKLSVALPRGGAARDDLFVADSKHGRPIRVQVKTARDPYGRYKREDICSWETSCNIVGTHHDGMWYAFVALQGWPVTSNLPNVYFVPSAVVAICLEKGVGQSRTFFWMKLPDSVPYLNADGLELLKAAVKQ